MKIFKLFILLVFLTALFTTYAYADIYSWTDEKGVKHYSNQPPPDVDAKVEFKEYQHDSAADEKRINMDQKEFQSLVKELDANERKEKQEAQQKAAQAQKNKPPTNEEKIAAEKARLDNKINELTAKPLDYFGSEKNKRVRIGYYRYRLEQLTQDPEKYFKKPESFEGNVKPAGNSK
jgi:chromosome segregation ATPase